jgi:hypothetical protein
MIPDLIQTERAACPNGCLPGERSLLHRVVRGDKTA